MSVAVSDYFSVKETSEDIEPFREIRDPDIVSANSTYEFAIGGDIVSAEDYAQGTQAAAPREVEDFDGEIYVPEGFTERSFAAKLKPRTIDDLTDPYGSPMLEGFLQTDFEPAAVIAAFDEDGNPIFVGE